MSDSDKSLSVLWQEALRARVLNPRSSRGDVTTQLGTNPDQALFQEIDRRRKEFDDAYQRLEAKVDQMIRKHHEVRWSKYSDSSSANTTPFPQYGPPWTRDAERFPMDFPPSLEPIPPSLITNPLPYRDGLEVEPDSSIVTQHLPTIRTYSIEDAGSGLSETSELEKAWMTLQATQIKLPDSLEEIFAIMVVEDMQIEEFSEEFTNLRPYHEESHSKDPRKLLIPKDFSMSMAYDMYTLKSTTEALRKIEILKQLNGTSPFLWNQKISRFGFDGKELHKTDSLVLPSYIPAADAFSSLTNEIHSIFRIENFHEIADDVYEVLKPSLRLASLFLLHPACAVYWHTLHFGERVHCKETSLKRNWPSNRILKFKKWSHAGQVALEGSFNRLANLVCFNFNQFPLGLHNTWGVYGPLREQQGGDGEFARCNPVGRSRIAFQADLYTTAKKLSLLKDHADLAQVLRFNLFFAVNAVHEVAHMLEMQHIDHHSRVRPPTTNEVYYGDMTWAEAGAAWETLTFGGKIMPIAGRADCSHGLMTYDYELGSKPQACADDPYHLYWSVPMDYVWKIQQQETWTLTPGAYRPDHFFVDLSQSATAVGVAAVNVFVWEDEAVDAQNRPDESESDSGMAQVGEGDQSLEQYGDPSAAMEEVNWEEIERTLIDFDGHGFDQPEDGGQQTM